MFNVRKLSSLVVVALVMIASGPRFGQASEEESKLRAFAHDRLVDAVLLYDQHFRVNETGQYLDAITLDGGKQTPLSSTASTGMGLISLAIGDALGIIENAEEKSEITLAHLLGYRGSVSFNMDRSKNGWFRHWFDAKTGVPPDWNTEKFSTIDSAILGAGAAILRSYLMEKAQGAGQPVSRAGQLAGELVVSVDWRTAIRNPKRGSIHLVFYGEQERPTKRVATIPFDEYAILPCMAASYETLLDVRGPAKSLESPVRYGRKYADEHI